jgi:alpha-acetolactate decarboxylase
VVELLYLAVGQSFFVADSEDRPDAAKSMASTVAGANARYAVEVEGKFKKNRKGADVPATEQTRTFICRSVKEQQNGAVVTGARIWRTL